MVQDVKREQPVRLPNPGAQPFVAALKTVRFFAVIFFWLAMVSVLAHVAAFVSAEWLHLYEAATSSEPAAAASPESPAAEAPTADLSAVADPLTQQQRDQAMQYRDYTAIVLPPMRALGILSAALLLVTLFLYLQIALLGRLSGIRPLTRAVGLALVFLAAVVPWHNIFAEVRFGAFFDFQALLEAQAAHAQWTAAEMYEAACYYARFLAVPVAGVVLLALAGIQFAAGYRESVVVNE